jgi:uncharacterized membrane protein
LIAGSAGYGLFTVMPQTYNRWWQVGEVVMMGLFVMLAGALASSVVWARAKVWLGQRQMKQEGLV